MYKIFSKKKVKIIKKSQLYKIKNKINLIYSSIYFILF